MQFSGASCPVCFRAYDQEEHIPRIFPFCGHTFCSACINNFLENTPDNIITCPLDKIPYLVRNKIVSAFPVNYALKSIAEEREAKYPICEEHGKEIEFLCISDKTRICGVCAITGPHQPHNFKLINQFYAEVEEKKNRLEATLTQINSYHKEWKDIYELQKETMLISLRAKFEILEDVLKNKEKELVHEINTFFKKEKFLVDQTLGTDSSLYKSIQEDLERLKNTPSESVVIDLMENQGIENNLTLDDELFIKNCDEYSEKIKTSLKFLNRSLDNQIQSLQNLQFPIQGFLADKILVHLGCNKLVDTLKITAALEWMFK